ncbi:MAG: hypothetical protein NTW97_10835 [Candidatus Krumholzibacteria bacterium]|nr:hypothetical protein [Candidatus Krumholzibacteria bacterium]
MRQQRHSFLLDRMLGKLCIKLRMLGMDAKLNPEGEAGRFLVNAMKEGRTAVTRARSQGDRPGPRPVVLSSSDTAGQIVELFAAIGEVPRFEPFTRCLECNELLVETPEEAAKGRIPPNVEKTFHRFHGCPACGRVYWEGSHFQAMTDEVKRIEAQLKKH